MAKRLKLCEVHSFPSHLIRIDTLPLSIIFNLSIQTGELPDIWKVASVTPIFKKGSQSDPANYRPISLTCVACKLLETGIKSTTYVEIMLLVIANMVSSVVNLPQLNC